MAKVLISLTPELLQVVDALVKSGMYSSRSEVVREALRFLIRGSQEEVEDEDLGQVFSLVEDQHHGYS